MFFIKIYFDVSRKIFKKLNDVYKMHQLLRDILPKPNKFIFRIHKESDPPYLLLYSEKNIDIGIKDNKDIGIIKTEVKDFKPNLKEGMVLKLYLRANPTVKKEGKRLGIKSEKKQRDWFNKKAEQSGCRLLDVVCKNGMYYRSKKSENNIITHYGVDFEGVLKVTDPNKFIKSIFNGWGSAKGFGFGMMTIAKL